MSAADRYTPATMRDEEVERVVIKHWRVVTAAGGIIFSISSNEEPNPLIALERAHEWLKYADHIELWQQRYTVSPSVWQLMDERVEP